MATSNQGHRPGSERLAFLLGFLRDRKAVGSITPSSAGLSRALGRAAGASGHRAIAELGAGTGPVTRALLDQLPSDGHLWAFEIKHDFAARLRARFDDPRLTVVEGSAADAPEVARAAGVPGFDAVVSAIPFSLLGRPLSRDLIRRVAEAMVPGAPFVALQYHPTYLPPLLREQFGRFERHFYLWNVPPAMILRSYAAP